jgi:hypothetical protein
MCVLAADARDTADSDPYGKGELPLRLRLSRGLARRNARLKLSRPERWIDLASVSENRLELCASGDHAFLGGPLLFLHPIHQRLECRGEL